MTRTTDKQGRPVVAITGMGLVTSIGKGCDDNWRALMSTKSGLKTISRFPIDGLRSSVAGTVDEFIPDAGQMHSVERSCELAMTVANEAVDQAALDREQHFPGPLFMATPPPEFEWPQFFKIE